MNRRSRQAIVCFAAVLLLHGIVASEAQAMRWIWGRSARTLGASSAETATVSTARSVRTPYVGTSKSSTFPETVTAGKNGWLSPTVTNYKHGPVITGLRQRVATGQAMSRPWLGRPLNLTLKDKNFPATAGWIKMSRTFRPERLPIPARRPSPPVVVHYNLNRHTGQVADPKVKLQTLTQSWQDAQRFRRAPPDGLRREFGRR